MAKIFALHQKTLCDVLTFIFRYDIILYVKHFSVNPLNLKAFGYFTKLLYA